MLYIFDKILYLFVYFGFIIGGWFLIYPFFSNFLNKRKVAKRFRYYIKGEKIYKERSNIIRYIQMLLSVTLNTKSAYVVITFFVISGSLFILSFLFLFFTGNIFINLLISLVMGLIPYLILQIKLHNIRVNTSYEADSVITELINQYKLNFLNMVEAVDQTIPRLKKQPYSKKALFRLSLSVKQYKDAVELENFIQEFNFAINTGWAMLLANNLFLSIEYGDDVREALEDILEDLKDLKSINEKNKQYNHETFIMIKYVAPGTYLLSVYAMFAIFGFTIDKFLDYQFKNPLGFKFFLLTVIFVIINYGVYFLIKKPKNDF